MDLNRLDKSLESIGRTVAAQKAFAQLGDACPELSGLRLIDTLKIDDTREVFLAKDGRQRVVVKRFIGPDARQTVLNLERELALVGKLFTGTPHGVNRCLLAIPDHATAVLSFAPGRQIGEVIKSSGPAKRREILHQTGTWLATYTSTRRIESRFGPSHWVERCRAFDMAHMESEDRRLAVSLIEDLERRAKKVGGVPVMRAATHGDFTPLNLHYHRGSIIGLDIQGECWFATARDIVRFLVWLRARAEGRPADRLYGLSRSDQEALLVPGLLLPGEHDTTVPFLLGERYLVRFAEGYRHENQRDNMRVAITDYLEES